MAEIEVRVITRAQRDEIAGERGGRLLIRLTAPPVDGAANEALVALLAEALTVRPRAVRIVSGSAARTKLVDVDGIDAARVRRLVP